MIDGEGSVTRKKNSMAEEKWLKDVLVASMLYCLRDRGLNSKRKLRLFAVACCRRVWHHLIDERSRAAAEVGERYANGFASNEELGQADINAMSALDEICTARGYDIRDVLRKAPFSFPRGAPATIRWACAAVWAVAEDAERSAWTAEGVANVKELAANCDLMRDIFGNPFRLVIADSAWRTSTVLALAQGAYEERDFDRMPILADALQDAGCDNEDILNHCRQPGEHVRGCWVVDLILGKS
jgi:hypothetical protein